MNERDALNAAYKGKDTEDFLQHIAWTDVLLPEFARSKKLLTDKLVGSILHPASAVDETREQIAGKLYGIDFAVSLIERTVREGRRAQEALSRAQ